MTDEHAKKLWEALGQDTLIDEVWRIFDQFQTSLPEHDFTPLRRLMEKEAPSAFRAIWRQALEDLLPENIDMNSLMAILQTPVMRQFAAIQPALMVRMQERGAAWGKEVAMRALALGPDQDPDLLH